MLPVLVVIGKVRHLRAERRVALEGIECERPDSLPPVERAAGAADRNQAVRVGGARGGAPEVVVTRGHDKIGPPGDNVQGPRDNFVQVALVVRGDDLQRPAEDTALGVDVRYRQLRPVQHRHVVEVDESGLGAGEADHDRLAAGLRCGARGCREPEQNHDRHREREQRCPVSIDRTSSGSTIGVLSPAMVCDSSTNLIEMQPIAQQTFPKEQTFPKACLKPKVG